MRTPAADDYGLRCDVCSARLGREGCGYFTVAMSDPEHGDPLVELSVCGANCGRQAFAVARARVRLMTPPTSERGWRKRVLARPR